MASFTLGNPTNYTSTRTWGSGPTPLGSMQSEVPRTSNVKANLNNGSNQIPFTNAYVNQQVYVSRFRDQSELNLYYHLVFSIQSEEFKDHIKSLSSFMNVNNNKNKRRKITETGMPGIASKLPGQGDQISCANIMKLNQLLASGEWAGLNENDYNLRVLKLFKAIDFMGVCITPEFVTRSRSPISPDVRVLRIVGEVNTYDIFDPQGDLDPAPTDVIFVLLVEQKHADTMTLHYNVASETLPDDKFRQKSVNDQGNVMASNSVVIQPKQKYIQMKFYVDRDGTGPPSKVDGNHVFAHWQIGTIYEMAEMYQMSFDPRYLTYTSRDGLDYDRDAVRTKMVKQCKIFLNPVKGLRFKRWKKEEAKRFEKEAMEEEKKEEEESKKMPETESEML